MWQYPFVEQQDSSLTKRSASFSQESPIRHWLLIQLRISLFSVLLLLTPTQQPRDRPTPRPGTLGTPLPSQQTFPTTIPPPPHEGRNLVDPPAKPPIQGWALRTRKGSV